MLNKDQMMQLLVDLLHDAVDDHNYENIKELASELLYLSMDCTGTILKMLNEEHGG